MRLHSAASPHLLKSVLPGGRRRARRIEGCYIGAKVGPAHVSGKRIGNVVNLVITWPKPVNGDTRARMTILNSGSGSLRIVVYDNVTPGGAEQGTSDLSLSTGDGSIPLARISLSEPGS